MGVDDSLITDPEISDSSGRKQSDTAGPVDTREIEEIMSQEAILRGVEEFLTELLKQYPQVNKDGLLNYYLGGSLAVMTLLRGGTFEMLDAARLPHVIATDEREVSPTATRHLQRFVRRIGDLDYIPLRHYQDLPSEQRLGKGGAGPSMESLSETARGIFTGAERLSRVPCDPLEQKTENRVVRTRVGELDVYVTDPAVMLAYKFVHVGESFDKGHKTAKFVQDFNALLGALSELYSREELIQIAQETAFAYGGPESINGLYIPYHNQRFEGELREFFDDVVRKDPDAAYLEGLTYGKERSLGILKILHRMKSPEAKRAVIEFINNNKQSIDKWTIESSSQRNKEVVADYIVSNDDIQSDFLRRTGLETATREEILRTLDTHPWAIWEYGKKIGKDKLDLSPDPSIALDIVMTVNEENIDNELEAIGILLQRTQELYLLKEILKSTYAQDTAVRMRLLKSLEKATITLEGQALFKLLHNVKRAAADDSYYDPDAKIWVKLPEETRGENIRAVFATQGIEY